MLVKIFEDRFVPGIGHGPFNDPISITEDQYRLLKRMGIHVAKIQPSVVSMGVKAFKETYGNKKIEKAVEVEEPVVKIDDSIKISTPIITIEDTVTEPIVEDKIDEVVETTEEESIEETIEEPETVEEEEIEESTEEVDVESLTKREIMSMLDEAGVTYSNTANKATLVSLLESIQ